VLAAPGGPPRRRAARRARRRARAARARHGRSRAAASEGARGGGLAGPRAARAVPPPFAGGAPPPALAAGAEPLLVAWVEGIRASARPGSPGRPQGKEPAGLAEARARIEAGDALGAWAAATAVVADAPRDAEAALLRARALERLEAPLPTPGIALLALCEARRAWDLDPSSAAAPTWFALAALRYRERHPGPWADAVLPAAVEAAAEAARLGKPPVPVLVLAGERRLEAGLAKDALPLLRRAAREAPDDAAVSLLLARAEEAAGDPRKAQLAFERARERLGDAFPAWAREALERLARPR
jgi:hypothetical protein